MKHALLRYVFVFCLMGILMNLPFLQAQVAQGLLEEVSVQTDRDIYLPGETIWFRSEYSCSGTDEPLSKVLYIELVSPTGETAVGAKYTIANGWVGGEFLIPNGLLTGVYMLRVYTHLQRDQSPGNYIFKLITVINPSIPLTGYKENAAWKMRVYPPLRTDSLLKVVLRTHPSLVRKMHSLHVVDKNDSLVSDVEYNKNGMGVAHVSLDETAGYTVLAILKNGDTIRKPFPAIRQDMFEGMILDSVLQVKIYRNQKAGVTLYNQLQIYDGTLHLRHEFQVPADNQSHTYNIGRSLIREKVLYLVMRNQNDHLLQVKHVLQLNHKPDKIRVITSKRSYHPREKVELSLSSASDVSYRCTVSVIKKGSFEKQLNEIPVFLIENPVLIPAYIENKVAEDSRVTGLLDDVLFIEDCRIESGEINPGRDEDNDMLNGLAELRGALLRGEVRNVAGGDPAAGYDVYLVIMGEHPQLHVYNTNKRGEFFFSLRHLQGIQNTFLCVEAAPSEDLEIVVNSDLVKNYPSFYTLPVLLDTSQRAFIEDLYVNAQVKEMYPVKDTVQPLECQQEIRFPTPDKTVVLDDYIPLPTMTDVINELVPFVRVAKNDKRASLEVMDKKTGQLYGKPLILLDDLPVFDVGEILKIDPSLVLTISLINSTYIYGEHIFRGILLITTNTKNFAGVTLPASSTFLEYQTFEKKTEFASSFIADERMPDFKNTLYWNPDVLVEIDNSTVTFYCSDDPGEYEIIVRGLSESGAKAFGSVVLQVQKD